MIAAVALAASLSLGVLSSVRLLMLAAEPRRTARNENA